MKKMNIVFKIIMPLLLGLFLIAVVSIYTNFFFLEKQILKKSNETLVNISLFIDDTLDQEENTFTSKFIELTDTNIIITLQEPYENKRQDDTFKLMKNFSILNSTIKNIDENLQKYLDEDQNNNSTYIENNNKKYFIKTQSFYNSEKKIIGHIHILTDVTDDYKFVYDLIVKVSVVVLILIMLMIIYYFKFLQKKEKELKEVYSEIKRISTLDALTGLYNKRYYLENAPRQVKKASRYERYISFILIDVDNFKNYNDNYGHLLGDKILSKLATTMQNIFQRSIDCCYRVGGEEFLVITESNDQNNALLMAEKLQDAINDLEIKHLFNEEFNILTVSIGVCTQKATKDTHIEELYDNSDKALYKSKNNGRNKTTLYEV